MVDTNNETLQDIKTMVLEARQAAVARIDTMLGAIAGRQVVAAGEIADGLLDIRNELVTAK